MSLTMRKMDELTAGEVAGAMGIVANEFLFQSHRLSVRAVPKTKQEAEFFGELSNDYTRAAQTLSDMAGVELEGGEPVTRNLGLVIASCATVKRALLTRIRELSTSPASPENMAKLGDVEAALRRVGNLTRYLEAWAERREERQDDGGGDALAPHTEG